MEKRNLQSVCISKEAATNSEIGGFKDMKSVGLNFWRAGLMSAAFLVAAHSLWADVKMPVIFGDHMVLQQEATLPVWGTADAGEKVTVTVGKESASTTAGTDGKWLVKLPALPSGTAPLIVTVAGKNKLTFTDVLVGDVWVCSGQSNMEFMLMGAHNAAAEVPKANEPQLRLFHVAHKTALDPDADVVASWEVCTPDTVKTFTAVGYFFGRELQTHLNRPIGLIESSWGGTGVYSWVSISGLQKEPTLQKYVGYHDQNVARYPKALADFPAQTAAYQAALDAWTRDVEPTFQAAQKEWNDAEAKAKAAGQPEPPKPMPSTPKPSAPTDPMGGPGGPGNLFNGMIAPLIPYAIKGVIWYQGEANANLVAAIEYRTVFGRMITDWREKWGQGDFPFLFVQLASYQGGPDPAWAFLRESQLKTLALPNTGMATAVDIGIPKNVHPQDKIDVGLRLALAARHVAYGENLVFSGPIYQAEKIEGNTIRLSFTQTGSGLIIGTAPWTGAGLTPLPNTSLVGFEVAGVDGNFVPGDAKIDGNTVVVSSSQVAQPIYVRYGWADVVEANLYNKEGLPASPFRTDDFPMPAPPPRTPAPAAANPTPAAAPNPPAPVAPKTP
jgi:sialate O-acetylesterase